MNKINLNTKVFLLLLILIAVLFFIQIKNKSRKIDQELISVGRVSLLNEDVLWTIENKLRKVKEDLEHRLDFLRHQTKLIKHHLISDNLRNEISRRFL
jgi:hypothetical protein